MWSCVPELDVLAILDEEGRAAKHRVDVRLVTVVGRQDDATAAVGVLDRDAAGGLGDRRRTLRGTRLEQLGDTRQTLRDVIRRCDTTRVEGTHRQLGSGLTDRLGRDDSDGLADVDELAGRERAAVADRTHTDSRLAGQHRTHLDVVHAGSEQLVDAARLRRRLPPRR